MEYGFFIYCIIVRLAINSKKNLRKRLQSSKKSKVKRKHGKTRKCMRGGGDFKVKIGRMFTKLKKRFTRTHTNSTTSPLPRATRTDMLVHKQFMRRPAPPPPALLQVMRRPAPPPPALLSQPVVGRRPAPQPPKNSNNITGLLREINSIAKTKPNQKGTKEEAIRKMIARHRQTRNLPQIINSTA